jgi:hypothetical protein
MPTLTAPDLSKLERPNVDLPNVDLTKIELPKFDLPKVDVGKAVTDAATAVGLMEKPRSRWPLLLGAAIAVATAGFLYMNAAMVRERLSQARAWVGERFDAMNPSIDDDVAFTAAEPKPIDETDTFDLGGPTNAKGSTKSKDYPDGFGTTEMAGTSGDVTPEWEKASSRS